MRDSFLCVPLCRIHGLNTEIVCFGYNSIFDLYSIFVIFFSSVLCLFLFIFLPCYECNVHKFHVLVVPFFFSACAYVKLCGEHQFSYWYYNMISNRLNMPPSSSSVASKCQLTHWTHSHAYTKIMHHPLYAVTVSFNHFITGYYMCFTIFYLCAHIFEYNLWLPIDTAVFWGKHTFRVRYWNGKFRFYFVMILVSISTIFVICIFDVWTFGWFLIQLNDEYAVGVWWQVNQNKYRW